MSLLKKEINLTDFQLEKVMDVTPTDLNYLHKTIMSIFMGNEDLRIVVYSKKRVL